MVFIAWGISSVATNYYWLDTGLHKLRSHFKNRWAVEYIIMHPANPAKLELTTGRIFITFGCSWPALYHDHDQ